MPSWPKAQKQILFFSNEFIHWSKQKKSQKEEDYNTAKNSH